MKCRLCDNFENENLKRFSDHVRSAHSLSSEEYSINVLHSGIRPTCVVCNSAVRYVSYEFKKYCFDHSKLAMKEGGAVGGKAIAWNRGLTKASDERILKQSISISGSNNPFYGMHHSDEVKDQISRSKLLAHVDIQRRLNERRDEFELVSSLEEYKSRQQQHLEFRCKKCLTVQPKTLQAFERGSRCYKCYPSSKSNWELEVFEYVKGICADAISGDRSIISPKEIDVYVPSKKVGFECHGLYWHSEGSPRGLNDKTASISKIMHAKENNVRLFQFFDDEWHFKQEICKSMIDHRLGITLNRIGARELNLTKLNTEQQRIFFDASHIAGYTSASVAYGLVTKEGDIVAALSLRSPRQKLYTNMLEIARFSTKPSWHVSGGLNKLFAAAKVYARERSIKSIMTYVDNRFGDGKGYATAGFKHVGSTGVDYWYTDNICRYDRFKFRAQGGFSEREVALNARVSKIWGAGSIIMIYDL